MVIYIIHNNIKKHYIFGINIILKYNNQVIGYVVLSLRIKTENQKCLTFSQKQRTKKRINWIILNNFDSEFLFLYDRRKYFLNHLIYKSVFLFSVFDANNAYFQNFESMKFLKKYFLNIFLIYKQSTEIIYILIKTDP